MRKSILVVEDDEAILEALAEFLESEGYIAEKAANGKVALQFLSTTPVLPSAIILDLMMPIMDGMGFRQEQLRDSRISSIPVIIASADHQLETKKSSFGAVDSIRKPIDIDKLSSMLKLLFGPGGPAKSG